MNANRKYLQLVALLVGFLMITSCKKRDAVSPSPSIAELSAVSGTWVRTREISQKCEIDAIYSSSQSVTISLPDRIVVKCTQNSSVPAISGLTGRGVGSPVRLSAERLRISAGGGLYYLFFENGSRLEVHVRPKGTTEWKAVARYKKS